MSVSALPGTSTAGTAIALSASIVLSSPLCIVAKSPAPMTTSASSAIATRRSACRRSRWRSLNASSLIVAFG
jgi:hypothetical protein